MLKLSAYDRITSTDGWLWTHCADKRLGCLQRLVISENGHYLIWHLNILHDLKWWSALNPEDTMIAGLIFGRICLFTGVTYYSPNPRNSPLNKNLSGEPWLVWLSGLSTGLQIKGSLVWFPVRAHAWIAGQVPRRGVCETLMFLFLSFSFPSPLSKNKYIKSLKKKKKTSVGNTSKDIDPYWFLVVFTRGYCMKTSQNILISIIYVSSKPL